MHDALRRADSDAVPLLDADGCHRVFGRGRTGELCRLIYQIFEFDALLFVAGRIDV